MDNKAHDKDKSSVYSLFDFTIRNKEAMEQSPEDQRFDEILTEEEKLISKDIIIEYKKKIDEFGFFLNKQYMIFNYKIHRCMHNRCYEDIYKNRAELKFCAQECNEGTASAEGFVKDTVDRFQEEFNQCLEKAQTNTKNIMNESFLCYNNLISGIDTLKKIIKTEFKFYE